MVYWLQSPWFGVLFVLLAIAAWWACFRAPLGERTIRAMTVVPAAADAVWRLLDPRAKPEDWNPNLELRNVRILGEDPLSVESFARARGGDSEPRRVVTPTWSLKRADAS